MAGTTRDKLVNLPRPPGKQSAASTKSARGNASTPSAKQLKHDAERQAMLVKARLNRMRHGAKN